METYTWNICTAMCSIYCGIFFICKYIFKMYAQYMCTYMKTCTYNVRTYMVIYTVYVHVTSKIYEYLINMQPAICAQTFIPHINTGWVIYQKPPLFSFNQVQILKPIWGRELHRPIKTPRGLAYGQTKEIWLTLHFLTVQHF